MCLQTACECLLPFSRKGVPATCEDTRECRKLPPIASYFIICFHCESAGAHSLYFSQGSPYICRGREEKEKESFLLLLFRFSPTLLILSNLKKGIKIFLTCLLKFKFQTEGKKLLLYETYHQVEENPAKILEQKSGKTITTMKSCCLLPLPIQS